jgi:hypothetical protein
MPSLSFHPRLGSEAMFSMLLVVKPGDQRNPAVWRNVAK